MTNGQSLFAQYFVFSGQRKANVMGRMVTKLTQHQHHEHQTKIDQDRTSEILLPRGARDYPGRSLLAWRYCIAPGQKNTSWFQTRKFSSLQIHFHWAHKIARLEVVSTSLHLGKNECTFFFYLSSDAGCDGGPFGEPCGPFVRALHRGNTCCPLTRRPMKISDLISHRALKTEIQEWRSDHGKAEESSSEDHSDYVICMDLQDEEMAARFNAKRSITPPHSSQKAGISSRSRRLRLNSSLSRARPSRSIIRTLRD